MCFEAEWAALGPGVRSMRNLFRMNVAWNGSERFFKHAWAEAVVWWNEFSLPAPSEISAPYSSSRAKTQTQSSSPQAGRKKRLKERIGAPLLSSVRSLPRRITGVESQPG